MGRGAVYAIAAAACFAVMGGFIKLAAVELPNTMVVFLRNSLGFLFLLPWILRFGTRNLRTRRPGMHLLRCLFGLSAMYCFFYAIPRMDLAIAVLLNYSAPLFIPVIALLWLREQSPNLIYLSILAGFIGVALIVKPAQGDTTLSALAALAGLASGILAAMAMVSIRRMSDTEPAVRIVFYFTLFGCLISALPLFITWQTPSHIVLLWMIGAGACASAGQLLLTRAYSLAPASRVAALAYTSVIFAGLIGWALWQEKPDLMSFAGMLIIMTTGMIAIQARAHQTEIRS